MKKKIIYLLSVISTLAFFAFSTVPASAAPVDVFPNAVCGSGAGANTTVCGNAGSTNPVFRIARSVINILLYVSGVIAVIMIIIGAINYSISNGDQSKLTQAKNTILYAVVGLVLAAMSFAIVNFVVARLL